MNDSRHGGYDGRKDFTMVDASYFDKFDTVFDKYLPLFGDGENRAQQVVTAVCKIIYRCYNDGDIFDNTAYLGNDGNDLSSYANWLRKHTGAGEILDRVWSCFTESEYELLLKDLADRLLDEEDLERAAKQPKSGSVYEADGPYKHIDWAEEEEEDECEEDYDYDYEMEE